MTASPTVAGWELSLRIRRQAAERGVTGSQMAKWLTVSPQYFSQLMQGKGVFTEKKLAVLLERLEFEQDEREELMDLRAIAKQRNPFAAYTGFYDDTLIRYFGLEAGAETVRSFEVSVVPGLLQTEDYIRALMRYAVADGRPTEVEQRVRARLLRQQAFTGPEPRLLRAVIGQSALMYEVGGPEVHAAQLEHLVSLSERLGETLELRVVPFETGGALAALNSATFHLLDFPSGRLPTLGWLETALTYGIEDDPRQVERLLYVWGQIQSVALDPEESMRLIKRLAADGVR
ncbi:helix-turn-helix domain-containing protein [Nocardia farcinica]|uniref:helix-turn-helix domain-containing protein n=1 Tax=Nocardia farcinica TaxID=37329 RepID=UPI0015F0CC34|nr:helix-turn-helix transcriptional regulator [Nocardia farcinica]MBA4855856.1 helix-turn-helix domain-containing protein [Nocardia farcinica]MBC9815821.1 helix-turn-helix domain-containing protein [Nocardia farcinica]MBF6071784.1 helix-turn-helix domain-containing protein [Nocardia farcinica]MBF6250912.1 helix-turn-helix domain-containing protein [Nocardia farcinica]MBF6445477.1 helix-turn-helix domain-containing protein [Nocardia farcinica]